MMMTVTEVVMNEKMIYKMCVLRYFSMVLLRQSMIALDMECKRKSKRGKY
jgi:hypothetical protein